MYNRLIEENDANEKKKGEKIKWEWKDACGDMLI